ncbi:putative glutamate receptor [Haemaphysalis longicornis]
MYNDVLRVSIIPYKPHTTMEHGPSGEVVFSGPLGNIFNSLVQALRFNYTIGVPRELTTGSPQPNGSWTGSMGMLHRNESDLAMGPFFPATERLEIAQPSTVFYHEELKILAGRTTSQESSVFGYILAFDWMVWMFLAVALVVISVVTALFKSLHAVIAGQRPSFLGHVSDSTWMYLENLFFEASAEAPLGGGPRLLSAIWWLAALVLMNAFCGHMRACLMIRSEVEKIESVQQLVKRPHTTPHMWLGTSYVAMVEHSTNPDLQQIGRVVRERGTAVPASVLYGETLLRRVVQGRAAVISDGTSLAFRVSSVCQAFAGAEFYLAREGVVSHPLNSFARKDIDPLIFKDINKVIRRLVEAGLVNLWWTRATGDVSRCGGSSSSSAGPDQASTLAFADVFGVFVLWLACAGISCLVFFIELGTPHHKELSIKLAAMAATRNRQRWRTRRAARSAQTP